MGARGPSPKRSEERKGHRTQAELAVTKGTARPVSKPKANPDWCYIAKYAFTQAMGKSGTNDYAQNSDWLAAWFLAEQLDDYVRSSRRSSMAAAEIRQLMGDLMFTESSRRRVGIELEEPVAEKSDPGVEGVAAARERLRRKAN